MTHTWWLKVKDKRSRYLTSDTCIANVVSSCISGNIDNQGNHGMKATAGRAANRPAMHQGHTHTCIDLFSLLRTGTTKDNFSTTERTVKSTSRYPKKRSRSLEKNWKNFGEEPLCSTRSTSRSKVAISQDATQIGE